MKAIKKVWGKELILVDEDKYCSKFLIIEPGCECSYHYHPVKKETFLCIAGHGEITVEGVVHEVAPFDSITIKHGKKHSFSSTTGMTLLEVSTHHDDDDVVRITESRRNDE